MPYFETAQSKFLPGTFTVDTLPTPNAANLSYYAIVSDLFGEKTDVVLCSKVGGQYFWQPTRPEYAGTRVANADLLLTPLKMPSILFLSGAIAAGLTRTFTLDTNLVYPGASFEIANDATLGLGSILNVSGILGGSVVSMILGGRKRFFYDGGWKTFQ